MALIRILVLGATFFMVGLCPVLDLAVMILGAGIVVYSLLWLWEVVGRKRK